MRKKEKKRAAYIEKAAATKRLHAPKIRIANLCSSDNSTSADVVETSSEVPSATADEVLPDCDCSDSKHLIESEARGVSIATLTLTPR
ncbi:hypothetical protein PC116_g30353 [Phytophthora cactorum]|uniref:Uncharacterized protein n=1 Tax=Phytophthora cactorum TaxID=29920 RepID=A0A8T1J9F4_9STRA|nr:hypothetical protein Pcac1_g28762 [Phytophthora cactorum]KAG2759231.1 hypothetical protein Pcac1_g28714 [Phytophthora cactorum]KAG2762251.1 hypothetical protein Pcac1_g26045 [Phytophthora cactorum]KAG2871181.1 hypothetical protein PC114_g27038 [Phytophthora cactorum]KAG2884584.1 hypothetical protein PC117_g25801 [Phytophthora cactorum]